MRRIILTVSLIAGGLFAACSSDDDSGKSCEQLSIEFFNATEAYNDDQTQENCEAWKTAAQAYLDGGCAQNEDEEAAIELQIEMTDCSEE